MACTEGREQEYGWVNWTVDQNTPDVVYYQSFAEFGMGWKINVLDEGQEVSKIIITKWWYIILLIINSIY